MRRHYYDLLKDVLTTHDLMDHPERIYNMDETGMPLDPPTPRIVAKRGQKKLDLGRLERRVRSL